MFTLESGYDAAYRSDGCNTCRRARKRTSINFGVERVEQINKAGRHV